MEALVTDYTRLLMTVAEELGFGTGDELRRRTKSQHMSLLSTTLFATHHSQHCTFMTVSKFGRETTPSH